MLLGATAEKIGAETKYEQAIRKAEAQKKIIVMVIIKENCYWCHKLLDDTLADPEVRKVLKNYLLLVVNRTDTFPKLFHATLFPSIFYIDYQSKKSLYENVGYIGKEDFLNDLNASVEIRNALYR
jgi:thioredoxin-related protein